MSRTFINHPLVGTVLLKKTRPGERNCRYRAIREFVGEFAKLGVIESDICERCKKCKKLLHNPHSILMHIGNGCESLKQENCKK